MSGLFWAPCFRKAGFDKVGFDNSFDLSKILICTFVDALKLDATEAGNLLIVPYGKNVP